MDGLGNSDVRIVLADEVDVAYGQILAHNQSTVVALGVVPAEAVPEEVVEQRHARLLAEAVRLEEAVRLLLVQRAVTRPSVELENVCMKLLF